MDFIQGHYTRLPLLFEFTWRKYRVTHLPRHLQQIPVATDQAICSSRMRQDNKFLIGRIPALGQSRQSIRNSDYLCVRQVIAQQFFLFHRTELEFWIGQYPAQFADRRTAHNWYDPACLPDFPQPGQFAVRKYQSRQHHAGIKNNAHYQSRRNQFLRAQATASSASCGVIPNSASLARTASVRPAWTGTSTIRPFSSITSK